MSAHRRHSSHNDANASGADDAMDVDPAVNIFIYKSDVPGRKKRQLDKLFVDTIKSEGNSFDQVMDRVRRIWDMDKNVRCALQFASIQFVPVETGLINIFS
jgi:hypothetical protein